MQQIDGGSKRRNNESGGVRDQEETGDRGPSADQTWVAERCWPRSLDSPRVSPRRRPRSRARSRVLRSWPRGIAAQRRPGACACEQPSRTAECVRVVGLWPVCGSGGSLTRGLIFLEERFNS